MNNYKATVFWRSDDAAFTRNQYSRHHIWRFDGGLEINASASPHVVPEPYSDPAAVDPEEAFIASLASCHMLWFLSIAAKKGYAVADYRDEAEGVMEKNTKGKIAITEVILHPEVTFEKDASPDQSTFDDLHHQAHEKCFIANSVKTKVRIEPVLKAGVQ
ncbi:MAG TPA: OsmC family protein [Balneolaceae bacterium]